jgi:hypothetical protein
MTKEERYTIAEIAKQCHKTEAEIKDVMKRLRIEGGRIKWTKDVEGRLCDLIHTYTKKVADRISDELMPVVRGFVVPTHKKDSGCMLFRFWCSYCRHWHQHGWTPPPLKNDHRVAHCTKKESPLNNTGYYIRPFTKRDEKEMGDVYDPE